MEDPEALVGRVIGGKYRVLATLGGGAMGDVYRVLHLGLRRERALKVLKDNTPEIRERFLREAEVASRIEHPHVVQVFDCGTDGTLPFYEMELLKGESLGATLRREGRLPWARARHIGLQICAAVHEMHRAEVVHRDLKPDNCFRVTHEGDEDYIKLLDFGIAKLTGEGPAPHMTATHAILGTSLYMAPEQTLGRNVDHRIDVYAIGVILYHMLSGRLPFTGESSVQVMLEIHRKPTPRVGEAALDAEISSEVEDVVAQAMAKDREDRFATAALLGAALAAIPADARGLPMPPAVGPGRGGWTEDGIHAATELGAPPVSQGGPGGQGGGSMVVLSPMPMPMPAPMPVPDPSPLAVLPAVLDEGGDVAPGRAPVVLWVGTALGLVVVAVLFWALFLGDPAGTSVVANEAKQDEASKVDAPEDPGVVGDAKDAKEVEIPKPPTPVVDPEDVPKKEATKKDDPKKGVTKKPVKKPDDPEPTKVVEPPPLTLDDIRGEVAEWKGAVAQSPPVSCTDVNGLKQWLFEGKAKVSSTRVSVVSDDPLTPSEAKCRDDIEGRLRTKFGTKKLEGPLEVPIEILFKRP